MNLPRDNQEAEDQGRVAVADQLRRGLHGLVGFEHDAEDLAVLAAGLSELFDGLSTETPRTKAGGKWESPDLIVVPDDGEEFPNSIDRPVSGPGNPWSVPLQVMRRGDRAEATVVLGAGYEGAPARSHGGVVSAIFDDLCGFLLILERSLAYTASLTISYHAGTPLDTPITFGAWVSERDGRKLRMKGECRSGEELLTTCEALFITVPPIVSGD